MGKKEKRRGQKGNKIGGKKYFGRSVSDLYGLAVLSAGLGIRQICLLLTMLYTNHVYQLYHLPTMPCYTSNIP